jgi:hypothetical protein
MRLALMAVMALAVLAAACGSSEREQAPPAAECASEAGAPISRTRTLEVLRRHGFGMRDDGSACDNDVVAVLTNHEEQDEAGDVLSREGIVFCHVVREAPARGSSTVVRSETDGADAELRLENLTCTILADSPTGEEKIDPLERAFAELARSIRS